MNSKKIAAVIAAAGASQRMGQPKPLLDWFGNPVIAVITQRLVKVEASPIVCITGPHHELIETALSDTSALCRRNPDAKNSGLLASYQLGIQTLMEQTENADDDSDYLGTLLVLGDVPHIPSSVYVAVVSAAYEHPDQLIFPSFDQRRGHPFFMPRSCWEDVLQADQTITMRDWVNEYTNKIHYVNVESDAILFDMDTPEDYGQLKNRYGIRNL